jgi:hypothetical protein
VSSFAYPNEALQEWKSDDICVRALGGTVADKYVDFSCRVAEYVQHLPLCLTEVTRVRKQKYLHS